MYFVMIIADYLNVIDEDEFREVVKAFAECFYIVDSHVKVKFEFVNTSLDFEQIQKCMIQEDQENGIPEIPQYERGVDLDRNLMHLNWLLSFIVGATKILNHFGYGELALLAKSDLFLATNYFVYVLQTQYW